MFHTRPVDPCIDVIRYSEPSAFNSSSDNNLLFESLARSKSVATICAQLDISKWIPDRICAHSGWGETLGISEIWPNVPQILWPELWLLPQHGGYGFDPLLPYDDLSCRLSQLARNTLTRAALSHASAWILPTVHQANSFPPCFQSHKLHIIHEGIDTSIAKPNPEVSFHSRGMSFSRDTPIITFVNRNLERLRGFDTFMHSLPAILDSHPTVRVFIVGDNKAGYSGYSDAKIRVLSELGTTIDTNRIHFLGRIPYQFLIGLLQASTIHVYLSYPFVLSWSLLEAMACGCCIVGSRGFPVEEVISDGVDGCLVSIHDPSQLSAKILSLLNQHSLRQLFSNNARSKSLLWDKSVTLPRLANIIFNTHV